MNLIKSLKVLLLIAISQLITIHHTNAKAVNHLDINSRIHVLAEEGRFGYAVEKMNIFCYNGSKKELSFLLKSVTLNIDIDEDDFTCFYGNNELEVKDAQESHKSIFSINIFSHSKKRNIKMNPFNRTCIGVETSSEYFVTVKQIKIDLTKFTLFVTGLLLFFLSSKLSKNSAFFYLCGILLGVFASVLVLIWFISKLIPKKPLMYGALVSGWALVAYLAQMIYDNIQPLLIVYQKYVAIYIITTSVISFGICYYMGPPKHQRTKRLIMWALQLLGIAAMYFSSDYQEAILNIIGLSVVIYYFPRFNFFFIRRLFKRFFLPKRKLITVEEFEDIGRKETEKALKELREFVNSPNCKQWKVIKNLSQPVRFASFVEGDHHLTHDETFEYDKIMNELSDDDEKTGSSSDSSCVEESIAVDKSLNIINKSKLRQMPNFNKVKMSNNTSKIHTSTPTTNGRKSSRNESRKLTKNATYELSEDED